jgi:hypothetical protein
VLASGPGEGYVIIRYNSATAINASASSTLICEGESVNISAPGTGLVSYTWSTGSNNLNITVFPTADSTFIIAATNPSNCVSYDTVFIDVNPLPDLTFTATPALLCVGSQATLTVAGASSYTWDNGPNSNEFIVSPGVTTVYSVTGTSPFGCVTGGTVEVLVNSTVLSITQDTSICAGSSATIQVSGGVTYTWSTGQPFAMLNVTPSVTTTYIANATDANGCVISETVAVTVNPKPSVSLNANKTQFCVGDRIVLLASGADTYTFSSNVSGSAGNTGTTIPVVDVPHVYTVTGANTAGCTHTAQVSVSVIRCVGLSENPLVRATVFPNPSTGLFNVELNGNVSECLLQVYHMDGRLLFSQQAKETNQVNLLSYPAGVYLLYLSSEKGRSEVTRLIKE